VGLQVAVQKMEQPHQRDDEQNCDGVASDPDDEQHS